MPRLFLAVPVPREIQEKLRKEIEDLKKTLKDWKVNWVTPENLHLTLVFFGWVKDEEIENLKNEVSAAVFDFAPFEVATGTLTYAGRSLWLEIKKGREELHRLAEKLEENLTIKGSEEYRPFYPHLTIGRVKKKGKSKLPKDIPTFRWKADRLVLYESKLKRTGPTYHPLVKINFNQQLTEGDWVNRDRISRQLIHLRLL
ncbi:MAG: RNA 2',3'-cyclic phosphodiesterase [candidate division WWE3 bacterium]|nr:RNA 2',3'-cyclic phosphodiesterase [candidate division WWE3 bacterium]